MSCLSTNEVVGFLGGRLSEAEVEAVERHLDDCAACRFLVAELARTDSEVSSGDAGEPGEDAGASGGEGVDALSVTAPGQTLEDLAGPRDGDRLRKEVSFSGKLRPRVALMEGSRKSGKRVPIEAEGRYQIKAEHRRGGQARILVAYDTFMGREVAFKEIISQSPRGRAPFTPKEKALMSRRFLREARIAGRLTHPSIVHVYETGRRADGTLYYTMPLVRGKTLAEEIDACDTLSTRLRLLDHFLDLCLGIAYAHSQGVLHRDIKPENVLIGEFGETVLLDWGLAKTAMMPADDEARRDHFEEEEALTELGMSLGTPAFMSPEQAAGEVDKVDERSDIWGLGAVLYTVLTGEAPFTGKSAAHIVSKVLTSDLEPVRRRCPEVPAELAAAAQKALRRDPDERFQRATELAEAVSDALIGRSLTEVDSVPEPPARRRGGTLALAVTVALLLGALGYAGYAYYQLDERRRQERAAFASERQTAAQLLRRLEKQRAKSRPRLYMKHARTAVSMARSADRRWIATLGGGGSVSVWRVADGWRSLQLAAGTSRVSAIALAPDGARLAVASQDGTIGLYDVGTGKRVRGLRAHVGAVQAVAFAPDGQVLASGGDDRTVVLWELATGKTVGRLAGHADQVTALAFCRTGGRLASAAADGTVSIWTQKSGVLKRTLSGFGRRIDELRCSADGRQLGAARWHRGARIWALEDGTTLLLFGSSERRPKSASKPKSGRGRTRLLTQRERGVQVDLQLLLWAARRTRQGRPHWPLGPPPDGIHATTSSPKRGP